ncbi:MAG: hypothetical protein AAGE52_23835 [Myxococcota bacterium]
MGAHDWFDESPSCPRCGRVHRAHVQFDFRFPDYHDATALKPGAWIEGPDLELGDLTSSGYARVREPAAAPLIVAEELDLYTRGCECGALLLAAAAIEVDLSGKRMRLVRALWLDLALFSATASPADYLPEGWCRGESFAARRANFMAHLEAFLV